MATEQFYGGRMGPFVYTPTSTYYSGPLAGIAHHALVTQGQIYVMGTPTEQFHVIRQVDIENSEDKSRNRAYFFSSF